MCMCMAFITEREHDLTERSESANLDNKVRLLLNQYNASQQRDYATTVKEAEVPVKSVLVPISYTTCTSDINSLITIGF